MKNIFVVPPKRLGSKCLSRPIPNLKTSTNLFLGQLLMTHGHFPAESHPLRSLIAHSVLSFAPLSLDLDKTWCVCSGDSSGCYSSESLIMIAQKC